MPERVFDVIKSETPKAKSIFREYLQNHPTMAYDLSPPRLETEYGATRQIQRRFNEDNVFASFMPIPLDDPICKGLELPEETIMRANQLITRARNKFYSQLSTKNFEPLVLTNNQILELSKTSNPYARIAIRTKGRVPRFVSDFDGTLSTGFSKAMRRCIPNAGDFEDALEKVDDPRFFCVMFVKYMQDEYVSHPEKFERAGNYVQLRASVLPTLSFFQSHNIPVDIVSRQFEPIIRRALDKKIHGRLRGWVTHQNVHAITPSDVSAMYKGYYAGVMALENQIPVAACGDSLIDLTMLTPFGHAAISVIFVLQGSKLSEVLKTYPSTFTDWVTVLEYKSFKSIGDHYKHLIKECKRYRST